MKISCCRQPDSFMDHLSDCLIGGKSHHVRLALFLVLRAVEETLLPPPVPSVVENKIQRRKITHQTCLTGVDRK